MNIGRRSFIGMSVAFAGCSTFTTESKVDDELTVFLSDIHVASGGIKTKWGTQPTYQNERFRVAVDRVLALSPRPKRAVFLGDIALWFGFKADYATSAPDIARLEAAGIEVVLGLGNHDKHESFFEAYPKYLKTSPVKNKVVSVVDLGKADLLFLDSLWEIGTAEGTDNHVDGILDVAQQEWLVQTAKSAKRPFFCASHHPPSELKIGNLKAVHWLLKNTSCYSGWIYGHNHCWYKGWDFAGWGDREIARSVCIPSTGWWGDIGFALCRTFADSAEVSLVEYDFYFPKPLLPGEKRPREWDDIITENRGDKCVFHYRGNK